MGRANDQNRKKKRSGPAAPARDRKGGRQRPKVCVYCKEHRAWVDYKEFDLLRRFLSDRGKIKARRVTGNCRQHQSEVAAAIKTARELALLPYVLRVTGDGSGRQKGRRGGGGFGGSRPQDDRPRPTTEGSAATPAIGDALPGDVPPADVPPVDADVVTDAPLDGEPVLAAAPVGDGQASAVEDAS